MKSIVSKIILLFICFTLLVAYNYNRARIALKDTKPSQLAIEFVSLPETAKQSESVFISWQVTAPSDFSTTDTTIFFSSISTPSAVTKIDSPQALGYQFSLSDYRSGSFNLPTVFESNITFPGPGKYFLRAYSKIRGNHLWTAEKQIFITQ